MGSCLSCMYTRRLVALHEVHDNCLRHLVHVKNSGHVPHDDDVSTVVKGDGMVVLEDATSGLELFLPMPDPAASISNQVAKPGPTAFSSTAASVEPSTGGLLG